MVFAVYAEMAFSTTARRDEIRTKVEDYIASDPDRWDQTTVVSGPLELGGVEQPNGLLVDVRYRTQASQQAVQERAEGAWTGSPSGRPLAGSFVALHPCPHDEANPTSCAHTVTRST